MGLFLHVFLFPGGKEEACRAALERKAENPDHNIWPETCQWHMYPKGPAVQLNDGAVGFGYAAPLSNVVNCPVLLAYIYDDDFWGYELWRQRKLLDQFATVHDYFDEGSPPNRPGDAETMARCFGVEPERIRRYLLPWPEEAEDRAYAGDEFTAGDSWQLADFLEALGFDYDKLCPPERGEKEPNGPSPAREELPEAPPEPRPERGRAAADTPILSNVLTSRSYALERAEALGEEYADVPRLLQSGKYQDLASRLTEAIQAAPGEAGLYLLRAFCWKMLEGLGARSRIPDMIRDLTRLAELDPANRDLHLVARAYFHHWLKADGDARADLEEVLDRGELWTVDLVYLCRELKLPGF